MIFALSAGNLLMPAVGLAAEAKPLVLETSPLPISLTVDPGKTVSADLRVKQNSGGSEKLKVSLMKFGAFGDAGKPQILDRGPADDFFDWVKFDKTVFDAPNNVWQTVKMTISPPKTAAFGYYYAAVFSRVGDDVRQGGRTNSISGGTAVLVLMDVHSPNAKRQLQLVSLTSAHRVYEYLPANFDVKLKNTGNVHAIPQGNLFISKGKKNVATLSLNSGGGNILPGSNRIYPVKWTDGFPVYDFVLDDGKVKLDKDGHQITKLKWDWTQVPKFRMGKYTADLFAVYDDGQRDVPIEAKLTFWVIPWRFILVLLLIVALVGVGVYMAVRNTISQAVGGARRLNRRK